MVCSENLQLKTLLKKLQNWCWEGSVGDPNLCPAWQGGCCSPFIGFAESVCGEGFALSCKHRASNYSWAAWAENVSVPEVREVPVEGAYQLLGGHNMTASTFYALPSNNYFLTECVGILPTVAIVAASAHTARDCSKQKNSPDLVNRRRAPWENYHGVNQLELNQLK